MAILRLSDVRREVGDLVILDAVSAALAHGDRVGLVGANGAGKTTLLRICAGRDEPDAGSVSRKKQMSIGLLAQEANLDDAFVRASTLRAAVRAGASELERLEVRLRELEELGADAVQSVEYASLRDRFDAAGGYSLDQRVEATLSGLGFAPADWTRPPTELSGGEQTRASLARMLVADPDLLLLDEPTNHLDVAAIEWLEQALAARAGSLVVASHDRAFLDAVVLRVWELRDRRLTTFRGNYAAYLLQREERDARLRLESDTTRQQIAREEQLIQTYRSHRKYAKMHEHERRRDALIAASEEAPRHARKLALPAEALLGGGPQRSGESVVTLENVICGFPDRPVVSAPLLQARRGERIGIVGPNGVGKTTLLRTIAGELAVLDGLVRLGSKVQPGYLAQLREQALPGTSVLEALQLAAAVDAGRARSYLARFLFRGDDVFKPVAQLSGGERSRLELALLGVSAANLLLLDEPTNHLDIPAREALEGFLRETAATVVLVSHDRRLLETVCTGLWVLAPGERSVPARAVAFDGGYGQWRAAVADGWTVDSAARPTGRTEVAPAQQPAPAARPAGRPRLAPRQRLSKDAYRRRRQVVEDDLTRLGLRKNQLELALSDARVQANFVELRRVTSELADVETALAQAEDAWLTLAEQAPR